MHAISRKILFLCLVCLLLSSLVCAADAETMYDAEYCFCEADFCDAEMGPVDGIFIRSIPSEDVATVMLGDRSIRPGDVLSAASLEQLRLIPKAEHNCSVELSYLPIYGTHLTEPSVVTIRIHSGKNEAPSAENVEFETYKNIPNDGKLMASDSEGGKLTYQLVDMPKRGDVKLSDDGSFLYTPKKNKVGEDRFTYTATDDAGNVSKPATVNIRILTPTEKMTYADLKGSTIEFEAMWLNEQGLFGGDRIGAKNCFHPEMAVSRGEFLVMAMELLDILPEAQPVSFVDAKEAPQWMQAYMAGALRKGLIHGKQSDNGLCFFPNAPISPQEAAVMLQNMLELPVSVSHLESDYPHWASKAVHALSSLGIETDFHAEQLSRAEAAKLLYRISKL